MLHTYSRILKYAQPLKWIVPVYVVLILLEILFNTVSIAFFAPILKILFSADLTQKTENIHPGNFQFSIDYFVHYYEYYKNSLLEGNKLDSLLNVCCIMLVSVLLYATFEALAQALLALVKSRVIQNMRQAVYEKINDMHLAYFTNERKGDLMSRMTNDVNEVEATAVNAFNVVIKEPSRVIFIFTVLFMMSSQLTYFTLIVLPVSAGIIALLTKKLRSDAAQSQTILGRILGQIDETLGGIRVIKAFTAEKYVTHKFERYNSVYAKLLRSMDFRRSMASPISQFLGTAAVTSILYFGGRLVLAHDASFKLKPEDFFAYILLYASIIPALKSISNAFTNIQRGLISADRIFSIIDTTPLISDKQNALELNGFEHEIEFRNIDFAYSEGKKILSNISLTIKKGETIAIVGPSGGGKSTLIDLLPRFHDTTSGSILVDGKDIKDITAKSLRQQLGIVTQESILFNDTVYNNLAFGISATKEEVMQAAKIANAHEFIEKLEKGYQTEIGDRGNKLSGGQKQRLTIARAILKNPPILLLDEATSALDSESEHLVQEALNNLMKNRTSLIVAHRFSTIQNADRIVVIKDGEIIEIGTHSALIEANGLYKKLSEMQST